MAGLSIPFLFPVENKTTIIQIIMDIIKAKVYVCIYDKYIQKDYSGGWLYLVNYTTWQEFTVACMNLHQNGKEAKFIIHEWQNLPDVFVPDNMLSAKIFPLIQHLLSLDEERRTAFNIWIEHNGCHAVCYNLTKTMELFDFQYYGYFRSELEFSRYYAEEFLAITSEQFPRFDIQGYNRNLFRDRFIYVDGYVFQINAIIRRKENEY